MIRFYLIIILCMMGISGFTMSPLYSLHANGGVTSILIEGDRVYAATDMGSIQIFNWKLKKEIKTISLDPIHDFMGDEIPPKVYSIDKLPNHQQILALSQGVHGYRNIYLIEGNNKTKIIDAEKDKMMIKKAYFLNEEQIIFATLGNEILLFDLQSMSLVYQRHIGTSVFSDFSLNEDKSKLAATDESGIIHILNPINGESIKELKGQNVDNIYQLAYFSNIVIGAGQDRRVSVYGSSIAYYLESSFLVYSVGLSRNGKWGAYADGEENHIKIFNTQTKEVQCDLIGQKSTLTQIQFVNDQYIISSSDDPEIMIWKWR